MVTRAKAGIFKPLERMNCHVTTTSPLPRSHVHALRDPHWKEAMLDEYNALISNGTWALVPRPANVNVVRSMCVRIWMEYENGSQSKYECLLFVTFLKPSYVAVSDVDDTLYPLGSGLSAECTKNIKIEESKVADLCAQLYRDYGTTMTGLRAIGYDFDHDEYHRLPYEYLKPDPVLKSLLHSLPIRKVIFSNANEAHVAEVPTPTWIGDCFDDVSPIICKPFENAFQEAFKIAKINPDKTLFFDGQLARHNNMASTRVDYALESIHNIKEALPEFGKSGKKSRMFVPVSYFCVITVGSSAYLSIRPNMIKRHANTSASQLNPLRADVPKDMNKSARILDDTF
ncbi:haloacid dehalogenase-like domain-containing protein [Tanacetum coccineum]